MRSSTGSIRPVATSDPVGERVLEAALERIRTMRTAGHLRAWFDRELRHDLYRISAPLLRAAPALDRIPDPLVPVVLQHFLPLVTEGADLFPEELRTGSDLLSPESAVPGPLVPATVQVRGPDRAPRTVPGVLLLPGLVTFPVHVSGVEGASEVLVCFGPSSLTGAYLDRTADSLVLDAVR